MKQPLLHRVIALALISGSFLSVTQPAHADVVVIPALYQHEGLTFAKPLTYDQPLPHPKAEIAFISPQELQKQDELDPTTKPSLIISPTVGQILGTKSFQSALPTPKLYLEVNNEPAENKTPVPTEIPLPTKAPQPVAQLAKAPISTPTPQPAAVAPAAAVTGGMADQLFTMSNNYRAARGLPPFQKDDRSCSLAASRAPEIAAEVWGGVMHSGLHARNLPYWNTENIISMNSAEAAFNWWVNDQIHHDAIVGNYTYSCVACSGGNCAQEFTNYQPK